MKKSDKPDDNTIDTGYLALGGLAGITRLVERFYQLMDTRPHARTIRAMHPADLTESKAKLVAFLSGWLGGPPLYRERYGTINLPLAHRHLAIGEEETQSWLECMSEALEQLGYPEDLRRKLMQRFAIPAKGIQLMGEFKRPSAATAGLFYEAEQG